MKLQARTLLTFVFSPLTAIAIVVALALIVTYEVQEAQQETRKYEADRVQRTQRAVRTLQADLDSLKADVDTIKTEVRDIEEKIE